MRERVSSECVIIIDLTKSGLNPVFTSTITIYINAVSFVVFFEKFFVFQQTSKFSEMRNSEILNGGGGISAVWRGMVENVFLIKVSVFRTSEAGRGLTSNFFRGGQYGRFLE